MPAHDPDMTGPADRYQDGKYLADNPGWHAEDSAWKADKIAVFLDRNSCAFASVAEVGSGAGEILVRLSLRYPDASFAGYDISPQAHALAAPRSSPSLTFHHADLLEVDRRFDLLLCIDVFEHVPDYMGFLRGLADKADLKLFKIPLDLTVNAALRPNAFLRARAAIGHLHYFTAETAIATLKDCGYRILDIDYAAGGAERPRARWRHRLARLPRRLGDRLAPALAARILGGSSLLVLAR